MLHVYHAIMPSLKVSNIANKHTFGHFYSSFIEIFNNQDSIPTNVSIIVNNVSIIGIIKMTIICIVISACLFMIGFGWSDVLYFNYDKFYEKYQLYYLYDWITFVIFPFFSLLCINHIFLNGYYNYSLKHNIILSFIVGVLINGTIISLLYWQLHEYNNYIWYWRWICNNSFINQTHFQSNCAFFFSPAGLYSHAFGYPLCLFLMVVLNYLMSIVFRNASWTKENSFVNNFTQRIQMSGQDLNQSLVNTQLQLVENEENISSNTYVTTGMRKKFQHSFSLLIAFTFVVFVYFCAMYFVQATLYFYTKNINYYFYCLLFLTSFFKLLLKFLARKIDINNMNCNHNSTKWYHYISMELFIEFNINFQYFVNYYQLFIYELSSLNHVSNILEIIFLHLLSESCQSITRFSSFYFDITKKIYTTTQFYHNYYNGGKLLSLFLDVLEDDSNNNEWQIKHSIDSSIRFMSLICSFCFVVFELITVPHTYFLISSKDDFYNGIFYFCLSFLCDLMYFLCLFVYNYYFNHGFNIWKPVVFMFNANGNALVLMSVCALLVVQTLF